MELIHEYVYRGDVPRSHTSRIGVLVAEKRHGKVMLGWSRCATSLGDTFDWQHGVETARGNCGRPLPISFARRQKELARFRARAARYFKDDPIPAWQ